ncbi:hypothetical protein Hanom_Chr14g01276701 [Helianthus anomalus]
MKLNSFKTPLTKLCDYGFCNGIHQLKFSSFFTLKHQVSNFTVSGLLNPVPVTNHQKTKPRGDQVVYTCRVAVEYAKCDGNGIPQSYIVYGWGQRSSFVFFNVFFSLCFFFQCCCMLRYEAFILRVLNFAID